MKEKIDAIRDPVIFDTLFRPRLLAWILFIGTPADETAQMIATIRDRFLSSASIEEVEEELHHLLMALNPDQVRARLQEEEVLVFQEVLPHLVPGTVLDIGTGSGMIAKAIHESNHPCTLVDVIDFNRSGLPSHLYDGHTLPFPDNAFDNVTLLTVLHHCDAPDEVLSEAIRVSRNNLVIIESVFVSDDEFKGNMFFDWLWNRVVYRGVNVPFHFRHPRDWEAAFAAGGATVIHSLDLGYDSPMTPEHHWLFGLKKISGHKE